MPIVDAYGREITSTKPESREIAVSTIRDRWASYPSKGLTPGKLASILQEADQGEVFRQAELFEEMEEKDGHLLSVMQTRKNAVSGLPWELAAAEKGARGEDVTGFCREVLDGVENFEEILHDLMDAVGKGYSGVEIMWETGKKYVPARLKHVPTRRLTFFNKDFNSGILEYPRVITDAEPIYGEEWPAYKLIYHTYKAKAGNVTRGGLLRVCTWLYLFKNYDLKDWVTFCEVYGMPLRLGKYDATTSKEDKEALIQAVTMLGTDAAGIISTSTQIEFVETVKGTQGADVFKLFADFLEAEMSKAVLGQTLSSGTGEKGGGSYALGKVHNEVRGDLRKADARALSRTIKRDLLTALVFYNFGPEVPVPKFALLAEDSEDLVNRIKIDSEAQKMGYPITKKYMSSKYGLPEPADGEDVLVPISGGKDTVPLDSPATLKRRVALKALPKQTGEPDAVDMMTERLMSEFDMGGLMAPVARLVAEATSMEGLRDKIQGMYGAMDATEFGNMLQRAMTAAEMAGRFESK